MHLSASQRMTAHDAFLGSSFETEQWRLRLDVCVPHTSTGPSELTQSPGPIPMPMLTALRRNRRTIPLVLLVLTLWALFHVSARKSTAQNSTTTRLSNAPLVTHGDKQLGVTRKNQSTGKATRAAFVVVMDQTQEWEMSETIQSYEVRFNHIHNYNWVFLTETALSLEFKELATYLCSGMATFYHIERAQWPFPKGVDPEEAHNWRKMMKELNLSEDNDLQSRHKSRFMSGFFQFHEALVSYDYYWKVEPNNRLTCDVNYDPFLLMKDHGKKFSFIAAQHNDDRRGPSIFKHALQFTHEFPEMIPGNNSNTFVDLNEKVEVNNKLHCEFWSTFQIGDLNWLRSQEHQRFFQYLDSKGGFYLENWTDGVFQTLAAALLLPKSQLHWFSDMGFERDLYSVCPYEKNVRLSARCTCDPKKSVTWNSKKFCMHKFFIVNKLERPEDWRDHLNKDL